MTQTANFSDTDQAILKLLDLTEELIALGKYDEAERFLGEIEKYKPHDLNIPFQRGIILRQKNEHAKAIELFKIVDQAKPDFFANLNNLGASYFSIQQFDMSMSYYKKAHEIVPNSDLIIMMIGLCLTRLGYLDDAIQYYRRALEITPTLIETHSGLVMTMMYTESVTPEELKKEAIKYGSKVNPLWREGTFENTKDKNRKLKIGYVSQDYRDHPVPYFLDPLLQCHDREKVEVYAYSSTGFDNPVMERMKTHVDAWRNIYGMDSDKAYDLIKKDGIDILVDVSGHTGMNNLKLFARKPAPIQVTWLGCPITTGMKAMDYKISDSQVEPPGMCEHLNTEEIWRLPSIFCCYQPHENSPDVIDHSPFEDNGYITFGCFNNFIKVRGPVMAAWAEILRQLPDARLLLEVNAAEEPSFMKSIQERLKNHGCPLDRITIEPRKRSNQFVLYNKIDIALDTFPCTGGTTTTDTLWMGVPLVTYAGKQFASRMSTSILQNAGLPELIAPDVEGYIETAVNLANDRERLKKIRHNLREKFAASPGMDKKSFARDMEDAYRGMWQRYCDS